MQIDTALRAHELGQRYVRRVRKFRTLAGRMPAWLRATAKKELAEIHTSWRAARNLLRSGL